MRSWFGKSAHQDSTDLPLYKQRGCFMREADRVLFNCLQQVVGQAYHVFPKVKLSELVEPQTESGNRVHQLHWIKVHRQKVDFLICRRHDMVPLVAIRLLSKADCARRGVSGQDVVDTVLRDIGLPKLTVSERKKYDPDDLKKKLKIAMSENQSQGTASDHGDKNNSPHTSAPN